MKKLLFPALALVLMGQGCFASAPAPEMTEEETVMDEKKPKENMTLDFATTPQQAFEILIDAALTKDCDRFLALMTERLALVEKDCFSASLELGAGVPEIDWEASVIENGSATLVMTDGGTLTTMLQGEDGLWHADTVFWK